MKLVWDDGYTRNIVFGSPLHGIIHEAKRPRSISYSTEETRNFIGSIPDYENLVIALALTVGRRMRKHDYLSETVILSTMTKEEEELWNKQFKLKE